MLESDWLTNVLRCAIIFRETHGERSSRQFLTALHVHITSPNEFCYFKREREVVCGKVWWPILGICALHLTHPSAHTQQWTHTRSSGQPMGSSWGLAQGSHLSRGAGYSLPPPTIPAGPETRTHDLRVTSPTLYPLGHDCPGLTTRGVTIRVFVLNRSVRGFRFGAHYKPNDSLD